MAGNNTLGEKFLQLSAINAYGIWIIVLLFPLILTGLTLLIDETRSTKSLVLAAIALGFVSASYILRFYLVRNTESLRSKVLRAVNREQAIYIIAGGFWWWLITLVCAIAAIFVSRDLF